MVLCFMSRVAGCLKNRRAISSSPHRSLTPLFATPTHCPHQHDSKDLSLPLFSYSYALFCTVKSLILFIFNTLHTLCTKHPGWVGVSVTLQPSPSPFDPPPSSPLYSPIFLVEVPC